LILLHENHSSFYLEVPLATINSLCLKPRKYLLFLGWCVLGVEGELALQYGGSGIGTNGGLDNRGIYYYVTAHAGTLDLHAIADIACTHGVLYLSDADYSHAIDIEVIKIRTNVPSETTQTRDDFRNCLLERDACCVWTGTEEEFGSGLHIIPFKRGSEVRSAILCWEDS